MKIKFVLDTHALVWSVVSPDRLGSKARRIVESADPKEIAIPSASVMELGWLIDSDRIDLGTRTPAEIFGEALEYNAVVATSLEAAIKAPALRLPHSDPYDRLITAEALVLGVPLVTRDGNITDSGIVRVVW